MNISPIPIISHCILLFALLLSFFRPYLTSAYAQASSPTDRLAENGLRSLNFEKDAQHFQFVSELIEPSLLPTEEYDNGVVLLRFENCQLYGRVGEPLLPSRTVRFLVPPEADLKRATVRLEGGFFDLVPEELDIMPAPPTNSRHRIEKGQIGGNAEHPVAFENGKNATIYATDAMLPQKPVEITAVGMLHNWQIAEIRITMVRYNPVRKKAEVLRSGRVVLEAPIRESATENTPQSSLQNLKKRRSGALAQLRSLTVNADDLSLFYPEQEFYPESDPEGALNAWTNPDVNDLAIITTDHFYRHSSHLVNYIAFKESKGYTVRLVTEGASLDSNHYRSGDDTFNRARNIRNWLTTYGNTIESVLLIGNPHPLSFNTDTSIPMKLCYPYNGEIPKPVTNTKADIDVATDMYYAELSGHWDLDGDGFYGEYTGDYGPGGADKFCELAVGRIPCYDSGIVPINLDRILVNLMAYEDATDTLYREKHLIGGAILNFAPSDNDGDGDADNIPSGSDIPDPNAYTYSDVWGEALRFIGQYCGDQPLTLYEKAGVEFPATWCDAPFTRINLFNEWQTGSGYVTWAAHGGIGGAERRIWNNDNAFFGIFNSPTEGAAESFINIADAATLRGVPGGFVVANSCLNGLPESSNNLAYTLLREWAVGTVAGSRETVYYFGPWDIAFRDRGGNHSFGYRLYEQTIGYDKSLAEALNLTRAFTVDSVDGVVWSNRLLFNMYGDPTLTMINHQEEDESRIRIVHPVQYTRVDIGLPHSITWESRNVTGNVAIDLSRDGGFTWSTIIADTPNDHSETTTFTGPESYLARLRIRSLADPAIKDVSDYIFYIKLPPLPETPTHVSATDGAFTDRVLIGWQPSDYVSSYTILRGTGPVLFELGTVPFNAFFDMDVQAGTTYTYRVRANNASGSSENSQTDTGYIRTVIQIPTAPPTVNASDGAYADRVRIQWEESEGASFYRVFRAPATSGPVIYAEIGTSDTIVFDDLTAEQNTVYSYKIKGANYLFESAFSISDSGYRTYKSDLPDPPAVVSASDGEYADRVLVSWKPAANALGYNIYRARKTIGLPIYGKIGSSRSTAFEDDTAVPETVYEYAVSSLASMFESDLSDPNSGYASILVAPPEAPTGLDASDGTHPGMVRITWSPVDGAALYNLYRAMDGAATPLYLLIGDTGNNSFDDYGVYPGRTYLYRVQAVNEMGISSTSNTDTGFCGCVGDFDGDGDTDGTDLAEFAAALEDGTNILTYLKFASYFGLQCF